MKYFTINEMIRSATAKRHGIENIPDEQSRVNLKLLVENILDPLREAWGAPIIVDSGYRCPALNRIVKGSATSQHLTGQAADIHTLKDTVTENKMLFSLIRELKLPYDQLIDEYNYNWIHVSYSPRHRRRILHLPCRTTT